MTIGIDIRVLGQKIRSGIEEYTEQLLAHMLALDKSVNFKLFYSSLRNDLPDYDWLGLPNVKLYGFRVPNQCLFFSSRMLGRPQVDRMIGGADVFFSPHFFLSSLSPDCRRVTTFHDLAFERFPEFFTACQRFWHRFEMQPIWQSRFSDRIIAVSESTKDDLVRIYGVDPAKVSVIYSGVSPEIKRPGEAELAAFREVKKLPAEFILFMGKLEPRKNIPSVIRAFDALKELPRFRETYLVIAGEKGWLCGDVYRLVKKSPHRSRIIFTGHVPDGERAYYYSLAGVFVYPSFFEGFGFPALEAMACGTPVIASDAASLPEVVGDGGLLVDPYNTGGLAAALRDILTDVKLKNRLIEKGLAQAAKFSWQKCAQATLETLVGASRFESRI